MLGAIIGDIVGSVYEHARPPIKTTVFDFFTERSFFTDDTVLTCAVADAILHNKDYGEMIQQYGRNYPGRGYGGRFQRWLFTDPPMPYNSFGNGSAMRVSPVGFAFDTVEDVLREAEKTALPTHNHPEGIKGAQATALAVYMARTGSAKEDIRGEISSRFGYDLQRTCDDIRPHYSFDVTCQGSVPEALIAFFDSTDFESAIRLAISLGGDADTLACIAGGIAQAYYGEIPAGIKVKTLQRLPVVLQQVVERFHAAYGINELSA
ncbi:MAG: ADP-ribosylglycohydrolase family protein [Anaerolineae bacterium]|jgi:ADP-ribosylglycohydrolase|nr:ADP-ribosylglycohydrolase family protein [Anaerolineae bacterium]